MQDSRDNWVWPCPAPPLLPDDSWHNDTLPTDLVDVHINQHIDVSLAGRGLQLGVLVFRRVPSIGFQLLALSLLCSSCMGTAVGSQTAEGPMLVYVWRSLLALCLCVPWLCTTLYYHRAVLDTLWEPGMLLNTVLAGAHRDTIGITNVAAHSLHSLSIFSI